MKVLLLSLLSLRLIAQPIITSDSVPPIVLQGGTHNFTATCTGGCTWSLAASSAGSIVAATGVYTAPASVAVNQSVDGCQLLTADSGYNINISSLPARTESATWMGYITANGRALTMSPANVPVNVISAGTPSQTFSFAYTSQNNGSYQIPSWQSAYLQVGQYKRAGDRHYIAVRPDTCLITEIYNAGSGSTNYNIYPNASSGLSYNSITGQLPQHGGTNAAGTYMLAGMLKTQEVMKALATGATVIPHALNITLANYSELGAGLIPDWPATTVAVNSGGKIPYGARIRLKSTYTYGGSNPVTAILINTLKQYGFIVTDGGYSMDTYGDDADQMPVNMASSVAEMNTLFSGSGLSNFEFVNTTQLGPSNKTNAQGGLIDPVASQTAGLTLPQFSNVCVTDTVGTTCIRVLLQGPTIDFEKSNYTFMAGAGAFNIPYHISGVSPNTVNCTISPAIGTLVAGSCQFTPPASVASPTLATITISSVTIPSIKTQTNVLILPGGTLRLNPFAPSNFVDSGSNTWWTLSPLSSSFPGVVSTWVPNQGVYQDAPTNIVDYPTYGYGLHSRGDIYLETHVPQGNYMIGIRAWSIASFPSVQLAFVDIETSTGTNGMAFANPYFFANTVGNVGETIFFPVLVGADGVLNIYSRNNDWVGPIGADTSSGLGGVIITPVTCPGGATNVSLPGVWWPYNTSGSSLSSVNTCSPLNQLITNYPYSLVPMPSGANR